MRLLLTYGRQSGRGERGIALILVLWALVALAAVAIAAGGGGRAAARLTGNLVDAAQAEQLADAGIHLAINDLLGTPTPADEDGLVRLTYPMDGAVIAVTIADETSKVDLNLAGEELLTAALTAAGLRGLEAARIVAAILDWRDADEDRRALGAEAIDYRTAGLPQRPSNRDFARLDELRLVQGMTPALFDALRPFVTVHGAASTLDPARADLALLAAMPDLDLTTQARWRAARAAREPLPEPPPELARFFAASHGLSHTVTATVELPSGIRFRREALVWLARQADRPYLILDWRAPAVPARLSATAGQ
jgi:general secretion pathway protein K